MTLPSLDELLTLLPPVGLALGILLLAVLPSWRRRIFVLDCGGALAFSAAFLWTCHRLAGPLTWPPADSTVKLAWCVVAAAATGMIESPLWRRPFLALCVRMPVTVLLVFSMLPRSPGDGVEVAGAIGLGGAIFLTWWSVKELAARHPGLVLLALSATTAATGILMGNAGGADLGGLALMMAAALFLAVPVTKSVPRAAAGRGALAPVIVGLTGIWLDGSIHLREPPPPVAILLLALAPSAPWLARLPALRRRNPRFAVAAGLALALALAGGGLLIGILARTGNPLTSGALPR